MTNKLEWLINTDHDIENSLSKWKMCFNGDWKYVIHYSKAPNKFHRIMQRLLLGIHWEPL